MEGMWRGGGSGGGSLVGPPPFLVGMPPRGASLRITLGWTWPIASFRGAVYLKQGLCCVCCMLCKLGGESKEAAIIRRGGRQFEGLDHSQREATAAGTDRQTCPPCTAGCDGGGALLIAGIRFKIRSPKPTSPSRRRRSLRRPKGSKNVPPKHTHRAHHSDKHNMQDVMRKKMPGCLCL